LRAGGRAVYREPGLTEAADYVPALAPCPYPRAWPAFFIYFAVSH
jgi:hypothetical protein